MANERIVYIDDCRQYCAVGDIHGYYDELVILLETLGYEVDKEGYRIIKASQDTKLFLVGDLTDRGKYPVEVLKFTMNAVKEGFVHCARGNHDDKLYRALKGNKVKIVEELQYTLDEIEKEEEEFKYELRNFLENLPLQIIINNKETVIAHAGVEEHIIGVTSNKARAFVLYGDPTGEHEENGRPIRRDWAKTYRGKSVIIYGHTPIKNPEWRNNTINIDSGCFETGVLTAVKMPSREIVKSENQI